jgi:hypothetical protein
LEVAAGGGGGAEEALGLGSGRFEVLGLARARRKSGLRARPPGLSPITTVGRFDTVEAAQVATDEVWAAG